MNINPFIILISQVISLYNFVLIIYCVASWLINFGILNRNNRFVYKVMEVLGKIVEPLLSKIRQYLPTISGIDLSPIVLFLLLNFVRNVLFTYFYIKWKI